MITEISTSDDAEKNQYLNEGYKILGDIVCGYFREDKKQCVDLVKFLSCAIEQKVSGAQALLDLLYKNGCGVLKDNDEAVKWYRLAANQDNAFAQNNLANLLYHGKGVDQDQAQAIKWYGLAIAQGNIMSTNSVKIILEQETDKIKNNFEALKQCKIILVKNTSTFDEAHTKTVYEMLLKFF